ncbi:MAG: DUF4349 domain-containing protein [Myxococcales bacterium]
MAPQHAGPSPVYDAAALRNEVIYSSPGEDPRMDMSGMVSQMSAPSAEQAYAVATPAPPPPPVAPQLPPGDAPKAEVASDAVQPGPILIYRASFLLSVYEVEKTQAALKAKAKELGGFVSEQNDSMLTLRIPSSHFEQTLTAIEAAGKVRSRNVTAADVGEEYRDVTLRLRTAELLRQRLEAMLAKAEKVSDALEVQAQIERIVREIEGLKGHLRNLSDQIAYSTITIQFQPEARPDLDDSDVFKLPYPWLDELGLHNLLELVP